MTNFPRPVVSRNLKYKLDRLLLQDRRESTAIALMNEQRQMSGMSANQNEIEFTVTRFLDLKSTAEKPVVTTYFGQDQTIIGSESSIQAGGQIVIKKVEWFVLPRTVPSGSATGTFLAAFGLPCMTAHDARQLVGVKNTVIQNDFNVEWCKIGSVDFDRTFKSAVILPFVLGDSINIGSVAILNPETGTAYSEPVQGCYRVTFVQNLPVTNSVKDSVVVVENWQTGGDGTLSTHFAMLEVDKLLKDAY